MHKSVREEVLTEAINIVCKSRPDIHGNIEDSFERVSEYWSIYLGGLEDPSKLNNYDVAMMMLLMKIARSEHNTGYLDNYVDIAGYAANAAELISKNKDE